MLQTADAIDADSFARKISGTLNRLVGDDEKGRFAQRNHDTFKWRALTGRDNSSGISGQVIDLTASQRSHGQRTRHLDQLHVQPVLFKKTRIACDKDIEEGDAESGVSHPHLSAILSQRSSDGLQ